MSLRDQIITYCRARPFEFIHKGQLERMALLEWNAEADNCARRCRELENEGILERGEDQKGRATYRYKSIMNQIHSQRTSHPSQVESKAEAQMTLI